MKKVSSIILLITILLLTGCLGKKTYSNNDRAKLSGTITVKDDKQYLTLDEPIIIGDDSINKIEIDYDKDLKEDYKVTIDGTIKDNSLQVNDIDDDHAIITTYSNKIFKFTIPTDIIKLVTIKEIDNGFILYSTNNMDKGGEVVTIKSVSTNEYKQLTKSNNAIIERAAYKDSTSIILIYPKTTEYSDKFAKEYTDIAEKTNTIKKSIRFN